MGVIFVENIVFVAEMANLQIIAFDIVIKQVISPKFRVSVDKVLLSKTHDFVACFYEF